MAVCISFKGQMHCDIASFKIHVLHYGRIGTVPEDR